MIALYENMEFTYDAWIGHNPITNSHLHKKVEIIYVINGTITVQIGKVYKILHNGEAAIVLPNIIHSYHTCENCDICILLFDVELAGDFSHVLTNNHCSNPFLDKQHLHKDVLHSLRTIIAGKNSSSLLLVKGYIAVILGRILPHLNLQDTDLTDSSDMIQKALTYVTKHYKESISLQNIAHELGTSTYYISRIFSAKTGYHLNQYVNSLRIGHARHLLSNTSIPITTIAFESGFESQRSFNRAFKNTFNTTPRDYRKKITYSV